MVRDEKIREVRRGFSMHSLTSNSAGRATELATSGVHKEHRLNTDEMAF